MLRKVAALLGLLTLGAVMLVAFAELPPSGTGGSSVAAQVLGRVVEERHVTEAVGAVTFDYRALDTLGEEYILFVSVLGAMTLLRKHRDERDAPKDDGDDRSEGRAAWRPSDAVRAASSGIVLAMVVVGGYTATHGQVSPGGGFQGGVVLASAPLVVYLAADARTFVAIAPESLVATTEAVAVAAFVVVGAFGLAVSAPFLTNVLPLGTAGEVLSGGIIFALNVAVGIGVGAGLVSLAIGFMRDAIERRLSGEGK